MLLTRLDLYSLVCDRPLSKVAPELGISGTVLAAICKRYEVAYPGSGYWTRKSLSLPVSLPPLLGVPDEIVAITPVLKAPRKKQSVVRLGSRDEKQPAKARSLAIHPLLVGAEAHLRKTREIKSDEFLRPYKRILPDVISSEAALPRALSTANKIYLALSKQGYRVRIAQAEEHLNRIQITEQEVELKDRRYGRYGSTAIWSPDRPTIFDIDGVPIGLSLIEMTERATMRYVSGEFHREDSSFIRALKWERLNHSWTTEQDLPCGRLRLVAYSPKNGVNWSLTWQEEKKRSLEGLIPTILQNLRDSKADLLKLTKTEELAAAQRKKDWEEQLARYERQEDARKTEQALNDSRQQLSAIIENWGKAVTIERFFTEAEERLTSVSEDRRGHLENRLALARQMMGELAPLEFIESWQSPGERYRSKFS